MTDLEPRLVRCFETVFPGLSSDELKNARMDELESWDSVAAVTLINVVEEEFRIQIDPEQYTKFISFSSFMNHLRDSSAS